MPNYPRGERPPRLYYTSFDGTKKSLPEAVWPLLQVVAEMSHGAELHEGNSSRISRRTVRSGEAEELWTAEWFWKENPEAGPWKITGITEHGRKVLAEINARLKKEQ